MFNYMQIPEKHLKVKFNIISRGEIRVTTLGGERDSQDVYTFASD